MLHCSPIAKFTSDLLATVPHCSRGQRETTAPSFWSTEEDSTKFLSHRDVKQYFIHDSALVHIFVVKKRNKKETRSHYSSVSRTRFDVIMIKIITSVCRPLCSALPITIDPRISVVNSLQHVLLHKRGLRSKLWTVTPVTTTTICEQRFSLS